MSGRNWYIYVTTLLGHTFSYSGMGKGLALRRKIILNVLTEESSQCTLYATFFLHRMILLQMFQDIKRFQYDGPCYGSVLLQFFLATFVPCYNLSLLQLFPATNVPCRDFSLPQLFPSATYCSMFCDVNSL